MDVQRIRADFPILNRQIGGHPLIYLDNAATTHKPRQVLETIQTFYTTYNANIHRSPHLLGQQATDLYEQAHRNIATFIDAKDWREVVFVRNSTEAINLVAYSLLHGDNSQLWLEPGDEIVLTLMEHHSNLVPWQMMQKQGIHVHYADVGQDGALDLAQLASRIGEQTKLVCCAHVSNVLGTINPVREIGQMAHQAGALFVVDAAQSVPHMPVSVQDIGCDFLAFSGHKMLAPMGIGVLYGRRELLQEMSPFLYGGDMIADVSLEDITWNELPWKFEAGTPNVCGGIALGGATEQKSGQHLTGAVDYLAQLGMDAVREHEVELTARMLHGLRAMPEIEIYGPPDAQQRCGVVSFNVVKDDALVDAHLVAELLNDEGIAVRAGGHCAYPLAQRLELAGTVRASFYVYNTLTEIDRFLQALAEIVTQKLL